MISKRGMSLRIDGCLYTVRPGGPIPEPVVEHLKKDDSLKRLKSAGLIAESKSPESDGVSAQKDGKTEQQRDGSVSASKSR